MKVSIITSCYNRGTTIRDAIESVLAQDYPEIEYIVVDGASKDNSLEIINEYKDRVPFRLLLRNSKRQMLILSMVMESMSIQRTQIR